MDASARVLSPEGNARCFKRPASTLRDYDLCYAVLSLRRESLTQTGSIGFSGGLNEPGILGTQFTTCSITCCPARRHIRSDLGLCVDTFFIPSLSARRSGF